MVELARGRGVDARVADATALPFDDACCDVVAAMWMLYHVPDLDGALAQVRRVLRPGGLFVAVTNGEKHLASLLREAGGEPLSTQFSTQNGRAALETRFDDVGQVDLTTQAVFPDFAGAQAYLATGPADALPRSLASDGSPEPRRSSAAADRWLCGALPDRVGWFVTPLPRRDLALWMKQISSPRRWRATPVN